MARFYTVKETAQLLGLSTNTIYKYLDTGRLKGTRGSATQGRFRIPHSQIQPLLGDDNPIATTDTAAAPQLQATFSNSQVLPLLPLKIIRVLLIISLVFMVSELLINNDFSLKDQIFRLVMVGIFVVLSYQFTIFGKKQKND